MPRHDGSLARRLDFGETTTTASGAVARSGGPGRSAEGAFRPAPGLRLALRSGVLRGPDKYKVLEHRRRQAQINARRLFELEGE